MKQISKASDIWCVKAKEEDINEAVEYATISLPWTYDRMKYGQAKQKGMNRRVMNIMKGVLNQTLLEGVLSKKGYKCKKDWTNYRQSDIFDFSINGKLFDVKTSHIYSEYSERWGRKPFSRQLIIKHKDYPGPVWNHFFPAGIALSQMTYKHQKEGYIFGRAETWKDVNKIAPEKTDKGFWCSVPYGDASLFFHTQPLILERERNKKGFEVEIKWKREQLNLIPNGKNEIDITLIGEWNKKKRIEKIKIYPSKSSISKKEFSSLSTIRCDHPINLNDSDKLIFTVKNNFRKKVLKITDPSINLNNPNFKWELDNSSFINLRMPSDYKVYWIGFTTPKIFFKKFVKYSAYFIPRPGTDENTEGRLMPKMVKKFEALDNRKKKLEKEGKKIDAPYFMKLINRQKFNGGFLIAQMSINGPIGAASYTFPPQPGAFLESALYILSGDLFRMDDL